MVNSNRADKQGTNMTHPDTLQRTVEPEWGPQQAYAEGRSAYENSMLPNTTSAVRFNELSSSEQAFWVAHAAFRAALQPQAAASGPLGFQTRRAIKAEDELRALQEQVERSRTK